MSDYSMSVLLDTDLARALEAIAAQARLKLAAALDLITPGASQ